MCQETKVQFVTVAVQTLGASVDQARFGRFAHFCKFGKFGHCLAIALPLLDHGGAQLQVLYLEAVLVTLAPSAALVELKQAEISELCKPEERLQR